MKICTHEQKRGFTLLELLVVVSIILILASLLLVSISAVQERGRSAFCKNNLKQLSLTYLLYIEDSNDKLPGNDYSGCGGFTKYPIWVTGYLNNGSCSFDYTNTALLTDPQFAQFGNYIKTPKIYKCPSDKKLFISDIYGGDRIKDGEIKAQKVRSYSLNWNLGWDKNFDRGASLAPDDADIRNNIFQILDPVNCLSFLDVYSESICWAWFGVKKDKFIMYPAAYHGKIGNLAFVDGHVMEKKWKDPRTMDYKKISFHSHNQVSVENLDVNWLLGKKN